MADLGFSEFDLTVDPPCWSFPRKYNAAHDYIERNLRAGRGSKIAYIDDIESCRRTYARCS